MANTSFTIDKDASITVSNAGLTVASTAASDRGARAQDVKYAGKFYFEVQATSISGGDSGFGISSPFVDTTTVGAAGDASAILFTSGSFWINGTSTGSIAAPSTNRVDFAVDLDNMEIWCRVNGGNWNADASANPATNTGGRSIANGTGLGYAPAAMFGASGPSYTFNFGDSAFGGSVPSGFTSGWPTTTETLYIETRRHGANCGPATNQFSTNTGSGSPVSITTAATDSIIVVVAGADGHGSSRSVSSVTATGLTFAKYTNFTNFGSQNDNLEVWWAHATSAQAANAITVTYNGTIDDAVIGVFAVVGGDSGSPFDSNGALPATNNNTASGSGSVTVSTTETKPLVFGLWGSPNGGNVSRGNTFSQILSRKNSGGSQFWNLMIEGQVRTSAASSLSVTTSHASEDWGMIGFAMVPATLGTSGTWASTEAKDIFAGSSAPSGSWSSTEAKDVFSGAGYPQLKGTLATTEAKDTFAGTGTAPNPTPVFVNAGARQTEAFNNNITPPLPASLVNGNFLIAAVGNGVTSGKTFTFPAGWTVIDSFADGNSGYAYAYRFVDGTETAPNITWTGNTSAQAKIWQFSGVVTIGAKNKSNGGVSATYTNAALTTTAHNSLVVNLWYGNNGTVSGTPTHYTALSSETNLAAFDEAVATLGAASDAISQSLSGSMIWDSFEVELCSELPPIFAAWASTEAKDVWASRGSLIGGSWRSTDLRDVFLVSGYPQQVGTWGSTEAKDSFTGSIFLPPRGAWASVEARDTFTGTGTAAAPLGIDAHATGGGHDTSTATVSITTTHSDEIIVLAIVSGGFFSKSQVSSVSDSAGLVWTKRHSRRQLGTYPACELWWARKPLIGATTITVHTAATTGYLVLDALAIVGANTSKPFDTHTGAGYYTDNLGVGNPIASVYSNSTKNLALAFYASNDGPSTGDVSSIKDGRFVDAIANPGWTWLERVQASEVNGHTGTLESASGLFTSRLFPPKKIQFGGGDGARNAAIMQDVIVAADDPHVHDVTTDDVIRFFFDGPGQHQIVQLSGTNRSHSLALTTYNPDTVIVVAAMVQSTLGARVDHVSDDSGAGSGWTRRGIEVSVPGSLSLETWWCHFADPFTGNITVTLDDATQSGDIIGFIAVGINGTDVFLRGEIWDGHSSLPKVNADNGAASYQTTGNFSSLNQDVLEINFAANTGGRFSDGALQNFNEDPWLQFQAKFFSSIGGLLNSDAPNFNIAVQYKFSAAAVNNDHTELNVSPTPDRWLMITDVMPVGPSIPPSGIWGSVESKDTLTHGGSFEAIGIASPGGWVGFPPNSAAMAVTDTKDRATNTGAFTAIWDSNGWIGYIPAFMSLASTDNKDTWASDVWVLGPTTILARWESTEQKDRFGAANVFTWYTTPDSKGDRTSRITVTTNALLGGTSGVPETLVNGLKANNAASGIWVTPSQIAPMWFQFDFGIPKVVNEALWFQNGPSAQPGLWKWQGSNDASTWADLSTTFVLNGGNSGSPVLGDFSSNQTAYRYYRILQTTNAGGNDTPWLWEVEFKVAGFSGTLVAAEFKDRMNYQVQLIPKATPIPARKRKLLIVT